jgi:TrmH family RNA methyltransferase
VPDITSRQHSIVRAFKMAARGESEHALLDGWHLLHDAVAAGIAVNTIALSDVPPTPRDRSLIDHLSPRCEVLTVTHAVMAAMSPVRTPTGVVALAARQTHPLGDLWQPDPALVLVAVDIQDPGNAGAIVRSAEAGGATGVVFVGASADPWGWKALRAAMGSTFRVPIARIAEVATLCREARHAGLKIVSTVPRGGIMMYDVDLRGPSAVLIGSEGHGLDPSWVDAADEQLTIPMKPPIESLNVAVAAALLIYEARRQRGA